MGEILERMVSITYAVSIGCMGAEGNESYLRSQILPAPFPNHNRRIAEDLRRIQAGRFSSWTHVKGRFPRCAGRSPVLKPPRWLRYTG
jgi:hypothetical protein